MQERKVNTNKLNINTLVDEAKFTPFHWGVLIWCLMIIIFDGYDLVIYGVVLPILMQEWALTTVQAGLLASTALFGMMFGAQVLFHKTHFNYFGHSCGMEWAPGISF